MRKAKDTVDGRFTTHEYDNNQNIPLFRYTVIEDSPHSYMPEVSEMVWNDFFSHFSLNADGSRSYDGVQVKRNAVFADTKGHWAQNAIENTVAEDRFIRTEWTQLVPLPTDDLRTLSLTLINASGEQCPLFTFPYPVTYLTLPSIV